MLTGNRTKATNWCHLQWLWASP